MGVAKPTRTCKRCRKEKDKATAFYSPTDDVCIVCNADVKFLKQSRRLAREHGPTVLHQRLRDYIRRAKLTREALRSVKQ
jgi:hypothetical protein